MLLCKTVGRINETCTMLFLLITKVTGEWDYRHSFHLASTDCTPQIRICIKFHWALFLFLRLKRLTFMTSNLPLWKWIAFYAFHTIILKNFFELALIVDLTPFLRHDQNIAGWKPEMYTETPRTQPPRSDELTSYCININMQYVKMHG